MFQKELKTLSIDDIHPYARNPRNNADAVDALSASLKELGERLQSDDK